MPYFNLPSVPLQLIFDHLEFADLFHISLFSPRIAQLIGFYTRFDPNSRITFVKHDGKVSINIHPGSVEQSLVIELKSSDELEDQSPERIIDFYGFKICMEPHVTCSGLLHSSCEVYSSDFLAFQTKFLAHTLQLFHQPPKVKLLMQSSEILTHPFWSHGKKLSHLIVQKSTDKKLLSVEEAKFLLENVQVSKFFSLEVGVQPGFEHSEGFKARKMLVEHASWVNLSSVINSESEVIRLKNCRKPTGSQVCRLLRKWMRMEKMVDLEEFTMKLSPLTYMKSDFHDRIEQEFGSNPFKSCMVLTRIDGREAIVKSSSSEFSFSLSSNHSFDNDD